MKAGHLGESGVTAGTGAGVQDPSSGGAAATARDAARDRPIRPKPRRKPKTQEQLVTNREAQRRYEQRKKEKAQKVTVDHEAMTAELEREQLQHAQLTTTSAALEYTLAVRAEWAEVLETAQAQSNVSGGGGTEAPGAKMVQVLLEPTMRKRQPYTLRQSPVDWEELPATLKANSNDAVAAEPASAAADDAPPVQQQQQQLTEAMAPAGPEPRQGAAGAESADTGLAAGAIPGPRENPFVLAAAQISNALITLARDVVGSKEFDAVAAFKALPVDGELLERVMNSPAEELLSGWQEFHLVTRDKLTTYEMTKSDSALASLRLYLEGWGVLLLVVLLHRPSLLQMLMATKVGEQLPEQEERAKWDAIAASMDLSAEERARYMHLHAHYLEQAQKLCAHRDEALQLLQAGCMDPEELGAVGLSTMMAQYLRIFEGASALSVYPDLELVLHMQLFKAVALNWSPVVKARIVLSSSPDFPDPLKLLEAVRRMEPHPATLTVGSGTPVG